MTRPDPAPETLTAVGVDVRVTLTTKELAIRRGGDDVVLPVGQIARVDHAPPKMGGLVNGHMVVTATDGMQHEMHYQSKERAAFGDIADALASLVQS